MKAIFEFIELSDGQIESLIVKADEIEQRNGWIIAWKGKRVVAVVNEKVIKFCYMEESEDIQ